MNMWKQLKHIWSSECGNIGLWVLLFVYIFICGTYIPIAKAANITLWEYVLLQLCNHYYLIYGVLLYWIFYIFKDLKTIRKLELFRMSTYRNYHKKRMIEIACKLLFFMFFHIGIAVVMGMIEGLPRMNAFSCMGIEDFYSEAELIIESYGDLFSNPALAVLIVSIYVVLGLFFMYYVVYFIHFKCGNMASIITMLLLLANVMIGFKTQIDESFLECLFLNNYFIYHHPAMLVGKGYVLLNLIIMSVSSGICWSFGCKLGRR